MKIKSSFIISLLVLGFLGGALIFRKNILPLLHPKPKVVVGICCGEPPYEYLDKNGKIAGINKELMDKVFKKSGEKVKWNVLPFSESFVALDKGAIDVLCTFLHISQQRKNRYDFAVISQSYIVFIDKTSVENKDIKRVIYGLQSEAIFETEARAKGVQYNGFTNAIDVFMNFDLDKVQGMIVDINTLKDLLKKNYGNIASPKKIYWHITNLGQKKFLHLKNLGISHNNICGVTSAVSSELRHKNTRVYYDLKDLIIAFRSTEINEIIIAMDDLLEENHLLSLSIDVKNPSVTRWLGANKASPLQIRVNKNFLLICKKNSSLGVKGKKYGILEKDKQLNNTYEDLQISYYPTVAELFIGLFSNVIDGIIIRNFPLEDTNVYCNLANVRYNGPAIHNGFAFRKGATTGFDKNKKAALIQLIETEALQNKNLYNYQTVAEEALHSLPIVASGQKTGATSSSKTESTNKSSSVTITTKIEQKKP